VKSKLYNEVTRTVSSSGAQANGEKKFLAWHSPFLRRRSSRGVGNKMENGCRVETATLGLARKVADFFVCNCTKGHRDCSSTVGQLQYWEFKKRGAVCSASSKARRRRLASIRANQACFPDGESRERAFVFGKMLFCGPERPQFWLGESLKG